MGSPEGLVAVVAIVFIFGGRVIKSMLSTWEKQMELRLQSQQGNSEETNKQIEALRAEVAALRDTSTQFDISLENTLQGMDDRLKRVESKTAVQSMLVAPVAEPLQQRLGS
jgi:predicted  nucleic acid-binding Zn-ribbon protein